MPRCSFCDKMYDLDKGMTFVLNSGKTLHFCSSKCKKNYDLGRKPEKVNWIRKEKKTKKEEREELLVEAKQEAEEDKISKEIEKKAEKQASESKASDEKKEDKKE